MSFVIARWIASTNDVVWRMSFARLLLALTLFAPSLRAELRVDTQFAMGQCGGGEA